MRDYPKHPDTHEPSGDKPARVVQCAECPKCGELLRDLVPALYIDQAPQTIGPIVAPMYDLRVAAELIPTTYAALLMVLQRNKDKFPARYRLYRDARGINRRARILSSREIIELRTLKLRGPGRVSQ